MFKKMIIVSAALMSSFAAQSAENTQGIHPGMRCGEMPTISKRITNESPPFFKEFESLIQEGYDYSMTNIDTCTQTTYMVWGENSSVTTDSKTDIFKVQKDNAARATTGILYHYMITINPEPINDILLELSKIKGITEQSSYLISITDSLKHL